MKIPSILRLLRPSCPSAIRRLIVTIWIYSVQSKSGRRFLSHVFKEIREIANPSIANLYSPAAIMFIGMVGLVKASYFHIFPRYVFSRMMPDSGSPMNKMVSFIFETTATPYSASFCCIGKIARIYECFLAAIAETFPFISCFCVSCLCLVFSTNWNKSSESFAAQISVFPSHGLSVYQQAENCT